MEVYCNTNVTYIQYDLVVLFQTMSQIHDILCGCKIITSVVTFSITDFISLFTDVKTKRTRMSDPHPSSDDESNNETDNGMCVCFM